MTNWLTKRLVKAALTVWGVVTLTFALSHLMPGGPAQHIQAQLVSREGGSIDPERLNQLMERYTNVQPDKPVWQQYIDYVTAVLQGDLGESIIRNEPVVGIIADALPWTIFVMGVSLILTFVIGISLGAVMAYYEGTRFDFVTSTIGTVLNSTPFYLLGLLLLFVFAYQLNFLPTGGNMNPRTDPGLNYPFIRGVLVHATLPVLSMVLTEAGGWALSMRGNSISILGNDYLRVARLRGLSDRRIAFTYIGRNAILPLYTNFMIAIGFVIGGSVILEQVFTYEGIGYYMVDAVQANDHPLVMGTFLVLTLAVVFGLLFADLTYGKLDPRIAAGGDSDEEY
ncbi:ABC transporter permease [Halopiger xanaduensis]|uniref:ABC-type transporter, integral membrane subunit n=1 Tax=Halopiger xanaduensis (strain DSM 18323 / JCM 14033 / SH-6) TaxID=797210 RepID=F8DDI8_HALXS|nr:ABC transporter permease [Halopiger xanaduensis]AEH39082.1 ABC-type transporter, integral membrane subunit [Halopiger xanaduensis SH-6]